MNEPVIKYVGVPWYTIDNYDAIKAIMEDRKVLPTTFSQWRMGAEQAVKQLRRQGRIPIEAHINPETFPAWCAARGLHVDAKGRSEFAALIARERAHNPESGLH